MKSTKLMRVAFLNLLAALAVVACGPAPTATSVALQPTASSSVAPSATLAAIPTATWTPTLEPSATPTVADTPTPTQTPTATETVEPSSTPTPRPTRTATPVPWQGYKMTYAVRIGNVGKLWMPVPREWDGRGMANVSILDISPKPDDLYQESQGNMVAFWEVGYRDVQDYSITFLVDLAPIEYAVDPNSVGAYDRSSSEYERYTRPSSRIESDNEKIVQLARQIVGDESNPYRQAQLIHEWMITNIEGQGEDSETALSTLEKRSGSCGGRSWLFVALLRSLGVPARAVTGIHTKPDSKDEFNSGSFWEDTLGTHVWSEFLLPGYGWMQSDAGGEETFAGIPVLRIVLSRGEDIALGHDHPLGTVSWFHVPHSDRIGSNDPATQDPGESLTLEVEGLP